MSPVFVGLGCTETVPSNVAFWLLADKDVLILPSRAG